jgi:hypothetical protein
MAIDAPSDGFIQDQAWSKPDHVPYVFVQFWGENIGVVYTRLPVHTSERRTAPPLGLDQRSDQLSRAEAIRQALEVGTRYGLMPVPFAQDR